jgi:hypothetical protein
MWVFDRWSPYSYQNNREKYKDDEEKREFSLKECLWFCMTSLTPQVNMSIDASKRPPTLHVTIATAASNRHSNFT